MAFGEARNSTLVATSTLELGIDIGDLDRVVQIGAPRAVASFKQRLGRTGRRAGNTRNALFCAAMTTSCYEPRGWCSPMPSGPRSAPVCSPLCPAPPRGPSANWWRRCDSLPRFSPGWRG